MARYGLLGRKLGHSYSKLIHEHICPYRYDLIELDELQLASLMRARDFTGLNVTIPYKQAVIPYCDELSDSARRIGAVNTLRLREDGTLYGDNTDYYGMTTMLRYAGIDVAGLHALILGGGGTSLTARHVLADMGARSITIVSRTGEVNYGNVYELADVGFIMNTTPVGMYPDTLVAPIDVTRFPELRAVADVIYNPERTRLIMDAQARELATAGGLTMLVAQAVRSAEVFTASELEYGLIQATVGWLRARTLNIVLVGMPGSGKTTLGALIAAELGREVIDTDARIEERAGMSIPGIFASQGEKAFRELERRVVCDVCKLSGKVISTGGGSVLSEVNSMGMRQNGFVVYLRRPVELLSMDGRPLSAGLEALRRMERERAPIYARVADIAIDNVGEPADVVREILLQARIRAEDGFPPLSHN